MEPSRVCTPEAYILFYKRRDMSPKQDQVDSIVNELNESLKINNSPGIEEKKVRYTLEPPIPFPRKLLPLTPEDEAARVPCPVPRTRSSPFEIQIISQPVPPMRQKIVHAIPSQEPINEINKEIFSPWSRFHNDRYCNDEPDSNVIYPKTLSR